MKIYYSRIIVLILSVLTSPAWPAIPGWSALLEPYELAALLADHDHIRVLHVSGDHAAGHIPGSVPARYADFRGPASNPGMLPELMALGQTVGALGIETTTPVVLVHEGRNAADMGTATRIYWTLKSLGVQDLAILNGGFLAWQAADLPTTQDAVSIPISHYVPHWDNSWQITTHELEERLDDSSLRLIDARPPAFFDGSQSSIARPGTIAGAANLNFQQWFQGARLRNLDVIRQTLAVAPLPDAEQTVSFCNSGHWASINWFVLSEIAEVPHMRLYAESMAEWTQARRPMDNEPSRLAYYWQMTRDWLAGHRE